MAQPRRRNHAQMPMVMVAIVARKLQTPRAIPLEAFTHSIKAPRKNRTKEGPMS